MVGQFESVVDLRMGSECPHFQVLATSVHVMISIAVSVFRQTFPRADANSEQ